jgi:hypothetical protein
MNCVLIVVLDSAEAPLEGSFVSLGNIKLRVPKNVGRGSIGSPV